MHITDEQKREILRYLEEGKPLPDKYRFLLFDHRGDAELVWDGKTAEVSNIALPFQTIEQVDEPRNAAKINESAGLFDLGGRQLRGWTNKLIWGDNKLILSSLRSGALRKEIEDAGGLKLIYIDPPFDVGADFSMKIEVGDEDFVKERNILEDIAYRDTWGKSENSYISMMYERLLLMHDLLADDGSIYVHCDWRVVGYMRLILDEIFSNNFVNEIIWWYEGPQSPSPLKFASKHDTILRYAKNIKKNVAYELSQQIKEPFDPSKYKPDSDGRYFYTIPKGDYSDKSIQNMDAEGKVYWTQKGTPRIKKFVQVTDDKQYFLKTKKIPDVWEITSLGLAAGSSENVHYPTQKPEALLERIIKASSNEGDLVADFFCGSGTTAAVAEKSGRKWLVSDLGKFAIHATRKRMIGVQRQLKAEDKNYRAFALLNLGEYERHNFVTVNSRLSPKEREQQKQQKQGEYISLILRAYSAESISNNAFFHGKKNARYVAVGPISSPVSRSFVENVTNECLAMKATAVDILAFEFEMGISPQMIDSARTAGVSLALKYIPPEVFDRRAVEKGQVSFYDVAHIEVKVHRKKTTDGPKICLELINYSTNYSQNPNETRPNKVIVKNGHVYKTVRGDEPQLLTKKWSDWVDYWAVDFNYGAKPEIIRAQNPDTSEWEEHRTGNCIFQNEWQSFRARSGRELELKSDEALIHPPLKIAVKVVDIFGHDTMKEIDIA